MQIKKLAGLRGTALIMASIRKISGSEVLFSHDIPQCVPSTFRLFCQRHPSMSTKYSVHGHDIWVVGTEAAIKKVNELKRKQGRT